MIKAGARGSCAAGIVHKGQCFTNSPGLVLSGALPRHPSQSSRRGVLLRASIRSTIVESAPGESKLPSNATKASQAAVARRRWCAHAMRSRSPSGGCLIRSTNRHVCSAILPRLRRNVQGVTTWCHNQRATGMRQIRQAERLAWR